MKFLSDSFTVSYDESLRSILIRHPNQGEFQNPLVQIREETYKEMSLAEFAEFLGTRILLLMPAMRKQFEKEIELMKNR